ncbi:hypothetical protein XIS1_1710001 [Xenorhabdus innexi]|uniref:Uncharacterized protein n=2 Tax=Xenorhabdus innexi TaxID=290109 RepID=A0A1N6MWF6_9GAMM|nr:hypothetical protein Xinn_03661 [Xenorhabdus innexi]SIP73069.1 hypothetical protein XIS1_1710001 [Xenorhabdus innexi]
MGIRLVVIVMVVGIVTVIYNNAEAKSSYDGEYLCKINKELNDATIKSGGMYFFPANLDTARVSYKNTSFIIHEIRPEVFVSPKLTPITKFGILNKQELLEIGENTLIYGGDGYGLGYFRPGKNEFFISKINIPNIKGAYILSLEYCVKKTE